MAKWIRPGMTVIDVGACHGLYTKALAEAVGPSGQVWAIEPQPELASELRQWTPHVLSVALGECVMPITMTLCLQAEHATRYAANALEARRECAVPMTTLDQLQADGVLPTPIHAIKIDAQGSEPAILDGAQRLLETQRPIVYLEIWPVGLREAGRDLDGLIETLADLYEPEDITWPAIGPAWGHFIGHQSADLLIRPRDRYVH